MPELARFRAIHGPVDEHTLPGVASILHVDMDAFFVSVELLERPELRGKPVIVGGQHNQRGVVTAASYEARKFGVHSAMPLRTAGRLCPHAVYLDSQHAKYSEWSDRVATILAKVASDQAKPRGLLWVVPGSEARFLAPLSVRKIPGIGEVTERALRALRIETVEQLAAQPLEKLEKIFGQWGTALYRKARGGDSYEFVIDAEPKSISHNHTFGEDTDDDASLTAMLSHLSQKACKRLRGAGLATRTLTLTIRYAGLDTYTRSKTLSEPTQLDADIFAVFQNLFREHRDHARKIRLLGVSLSGLAHGAEQLDLLAAERRSKLERLTRATDLLRDRFGFDSVQFGGSLRSDDSKPSDEHDEKE